MVSEVVFSYQQYFNNKKFKKLNFKKYLNKKDQMIIKKLNYQFSFYKTLKNFETSLKKKINPYIDFRDAFLWSSLIELSKRSLNQKSRRIKINHLKKIF